MAEKKRVVQIVAGIVAALLGAGGGLVLSGAFDSDDSDGEQAEGEIFLFPAADVGPDPFSPDPLAAEPDPTLAPPAAELAAPITVAAAPPVTGSSGGEPGLYGGTLNNEACDPQQIVTFLGANPDKAAAWVAALVADPDVKLPDGRALTTALIPEYIATLTPLVLRQDTRVTNHGFKNGRPTKLQSVLQKGSAVLVDQLGVPRAKCYCGNPLLPPVASSKTPKFTGKKWPDFDPAKVSVVQKNTQIINNFIFTDIKTGGQFSRAAGTSGATPVPGTSGSSTSTSTSTSSSTSTTTTTTTTAPPVSAAPVLSDGTVQRSPQDDNCGQGTGALGYVLSFTFTDPDGDGAGGAIFKEGNDETAFATFGGDGSNGTIRLRVCDFPGSARDYVLTDAAGNRSNAVRVTTP